MAAGKETKVTRRSVLAAPAVLGRKRSRPNILFLLPDQLRQQSVGCLGNAEVQTPNIDRLAQEGVTLTHTFANTPVCCPARAVLLTGQYAHRNGVVANDLRLNERGPSLARTLREAGYRTGFVGKWHLDGGPREPGFVPPGERRQGFEFWAGNECSHAHFRNWYFRDTPERIELRTFETQGYSEVGLEFLREAKRDSRPWYLTVQWGPPHDPYKAPAEYSRRYDAERLTMRPNWRTGTPMGSRQDLAEYYAMTSAVDDGVGMLLRQLDELGMTENTIVLFASDHGDMLGSHGQRLKRKPWEESIRVPGILRWPGRAKPGTSWDGFFTHVDVAPTLCGMAGVRAPGGVQGRDLSRRILAGRTSADDSAFFQIFGPFAGDGTDAGWRGVRTRRYMYARREDRPWLLYDLQTDPYQLENLAESAAAGKLVRELEQTLAGWMRTTGDAWRFNWRHPVEDAGRLYRHGTFRSVGEYLKWAAEHPELDRAAPQ